jgi:hypothetical protein
MIYHIVVGDEAARPLAEAVAAEPSMAGQVVIMKDILHVGPLQRGEGQSFSVLRSEWWRQVAPDAKTPIEVDDLERLLDVSNELYKDADAQAWCWMAPGPADVCAYFWMLSYLGKHAGRFFIINMANLPFLDETGKVFYPKSISELLPKEIIKARKLARVVTASEIEMDGESWRSMVADNAGIRTLEGGKKILPRPQDHYDAQLISLLGNGFQKGSRVLQQAMSKYQLPTGDAYLAWRLRELAAAGLIELRGDTTRSYREWEVRLPVPEESEASQPG